MLNVSMNRAIILISAFYSCLCFGGGDAYPVKIESLNVSGNKFSLVARLAEANWYEDECNVVNVEGEYDFEKWARYQNIPMSLDFHIESLEMLEQFKNSGQTTWFGAFGSGLQRLSKCSYASKGLFHQGKYIFSIYGNI